MNNFVKENWVKLILVVAVVIVGYYLGRLSNQPKILPKTYIFAPKTFFDNKDIASNFGNQQVYVAGTLTGNDIEHNVYILGNKDNTIAITCYKDRMECLVNSIIGISKTSCQLGRLDAPLPLPIMKWDNYVIIATDENKFDTFDCTKTTINIDRKLETVLWVQEPINQSQLSCKDFHDNEIYKWTIEDPQWMGDFKANLKK